MRIVLLVLVSLLVAPVLVALEFPLPDRCYRATEELAEGWLFRFDPSDVGAESGWELAEHDRSEWTGISLPRVWDREPGTVAMPIRSGVGWFARQVVVPADWQGGSVLLHFLGVQFACDVWVNGEWVASQTGGYAPFALELGAAATPGAELSVVLRVDNRLSRETVPGQKLGWQPYGGVTREVYLCHRPDAWLRDIATATRLDGDAAVLSLAAKAVGAAGSVRARLLADGEAVAEGVLVGAEDGRLLLDLRVPSARLWSPDDPFLHQLELRWDGGDCVMPIGLRTFAAQGRDLVLNGRPLWLQGFGIHEEWAGFGPCVPHAERAKELAFLREAYGLNSIRPGHYPNHPELYRLCDQLGIVVFTEIPAWQIPGKFLQSDLGWETQLRPQLDAMIDQYRNFSSIVAWGVGNENGGAMTYHHRALTHVREKDPSRLAILVLASWHGMETYQLLQMGARNFHYGWYHSKIVYTVRDGLARNRAAAGDKPIWVAEQGAHAIRDRVDGAFNSRQRGSEVYQEQVVRFGFQYLATAPEHVAGISPWSWADFHRNGRIEPHGITDLNREPKAVAYSLRHLMAPGERLLLTERSSFCQPGETFVADVFAFAGKPEAGVGYRYRWVIRNGQGAVSSGDGVYERQAQRSQRLTRIRWDIPADASGHYDLWIELQDAQGAWLRTNTLPFGVAAEQSPALLVVPPSAGAGSLVIDGWTFPVYPGTGLRLFISPGPVRGELRLGAALQHPVDLSAASGEIVRLGQ
jgi:beta-glucuronidase